MTIEVYGLADIIGDEPGGSMRLIWLLVDRDIFGTISHK